MKTPVDDEPSITMRFGRLSRLTAVSLWFGAFLTAILFLEWELSALLTPFLIFPLILGLFIALAALVVVSVIHLLINLKKGVKRAAQPLLVNVAIFLIVLFTPFTDIMLELRFRLNWKGYNEVVAMVKEGRFQPNNIGVVKLPAEYDHLSLAGGEILIDNSDGTLSVFFFTFRGVLDNFSGFMYRANNTPPGDGVAFGDWTQVRRIRTFWFFCASI